MIRKDTHTHGKHLFEHLVSGAKSAGIKLTHQRLEIFRELAHNDSHPNAENVFRAVQSRVPTVSLDTVYRTLHTLRDLGLVAALGASGDSVRFDVNLERHHHYVCVRCGLVRDFESDALNEIRVPKSVAAFGTVTNAQVEIRGVCAACESAEAPRRKTKK